MEHSQIPNDHSDGKVGKPSAADKRLTSKRTPITWQDPVLVTSKASLEVLLEIGLPVGCYLTEGVTSNWQVMIFRQEGRSPYFVSGSTLQTCKVACC